MSENIDKLIARLSVGVLLLLHGVHKLLNGIEPIKHMVTQHNLPETLSYGVYLGELVGPMLVILGLFSRLGGTLIVLNMLTAIFLSQMHNLLVLNAQGGYALELDMLYLAGGLCVMLSGAGRLSLAGANGPLN